MNTKDRDAQWAMAERLQATLHGVRGCGGDIREYFHAIERLADRIPTGDTTMPNTQPNERDTTLAAIAAEALNIPTLETRRSDSLDFHEVAVWSLREALDQAYEAGRKHAPPTRCMCPACGRDIEIRSI